MDMQHAGSLAVQFPVDNSVCQHRSRMQSIQVGALQDRKHQSAAATCTALSYTLASLEKHKMTTVDQKAF